MNLNAFDTADNPKRYPKKNMSGVRSYSFREGDRSEYLAQFLLSGLGLCTAIPRQEDIGFDFSCTLADQETGTLTFGHPFLVSVKSASDATISCEPTEACIKDNDQRHIKWLFDQELPMFLASVDRDKVSMSIYSLLPLWFLYYESGSSCGSIKIIPRTDPEDTSDIGRPEKGAAFPNWDGKFHYDVDVGHPIVTVDIETLKDKGKIKGVKEHLREAIRLAQVNLLHWKLRIPHFWWLSKTAPDTKGFMSAFYFLPVPPTQDARVAIMKELAPSLISFGFHYKEMKSEKHLDAIKTLLSDLPAEEIPEPIKERIPELFDEKG